MRTTMVAMSVATLMLGCEEPAPTQVARRDGVDGVGGARGADGPAGRTGADGADGTNGRDGIDGVAGPAGPSGSAGPAGSVGPPGAMGPGGAIGPAGPMGPAGPPMNGVAYDDGGRFIVGEAAVAGPGYYSIAIGKMTTASGAGAAAIGEVLLASGDNSFVGGYASRATGHFSAVLGSYDTASGLGSTAIGLNAVASRPGELAHSSGSGAGGGLHALDLFRNLSGAPGALTDRSGGAFYLGVQRFVSMRARVMGAVVGQSKVAAEVHELTVSCAQVACQIVSDVITSTPSSGFASRGWSLDITALTTELRFQVHPGPDAVRAFARIEWAELGNL